MGCRIPLTKSEQIFLQPVRVLHIIARAPHARTRVDQRVHAPPRARPFEPPQGPAAPADAAAADAAAAASTFMGV